MSWIPSFGWYASAQLALPTFRTINPLIGRDFDEIMEIIWGPEVGKACADIFRQARWRRERDTFRRRSTTRFDMEEQQAFEWETQRVRLPSGELGVVCYFKEVTQLTRAQAAARASEAHPSSRRKRRAWESGNGMCVRGRSGAQVFRIYGVPPTADGMVSYQMWAERVLAEDLPDQERLLRARLEQGGVCESFAFGVEMARFATFERWTPPRVGADRATEWVLGSNLDITELKFAEQHPGATGR